MRLVKKKKTFYKITFLHSYKNVYNKSTTRETVLAISTVTRRSAKLALRVCLTVFLKSVFRLKNTFKCLNDKKMCLVIFFKSAFKSSKKHSKCFFEKHLGGVFKKITFVKYLLVYP